MGQKGGRCPLKESPGLKGNPRKNPVPKANKSPTHKGHEYTQIEAGAKPRPGDEMGQREGKHHPHEERKGLGVADALAGKPQGLEGEV